jgi:hypothetical protein
LAQKLENVAVPDAEVLTSKVLFALPVIPSSVTLESDLVWKILKNTDKCFSSEKELKLTCRMKKEADCLHAID